MNPQFRYLLIGKREGYILMEVMLAVGIFACAALALATALNELFSAATRMHRETHVAWALESRLNEAQLVQNGSSIVFVPGKETLPPDSDGVLYEKEIKLLELKDKKGNPLPGLYNIIITARWKEQNQQREQTAQAYVYRN